MFYPPSPAWAKLKAAILAAFRSGGGDFDAGRRACEMLARMRCQDVRMRAATVTLHDRHPYLRLPVQFATSLRPRILGEGLMSEADLDDAIAECDRIAQDPATCGVGFVVVQASGRKPDFD